MTLSILRRMPPALLIASSVGCGLLLAQTTGLVTPLFCLTPSDAIVVSPQLIWQSIVATLALNAPSALALSWAVMMLAMMPLLLEQPLRHLRRRSLRRRQHRAVLVFAIGYGAVWLAAGVVLSIVALAVGAVLAATAMPGPAALMLGAGLVIGWAMTPLRQRCLNGCQRHPCLSAIGIAADADVLRFGVAHGAWCVGACWALMLLPLLAGPWHLPVMAAAGLWLLPERYRAPRPARWGLGPATSAAWIRQSSRLADVPRLLFHAAIGRGAIASFSDKASS